VLEQLTEAEARQRKLEAEQEFEDKLFAIKEAQSRKRVQLLTAEQRANIQGAISLGNNLIALSGQQGKRAFKLQKTLAVAQALLNARESITSAFAFGSRVGGPVVGAAFAAIAAAATAAQVAQVKSTNVGGGGGVSAGGGAGAGASSVAQGAADVGKQLLGGGTTVTQETAPRQTAQIQIVGNGESFSRDQVIKMVEGINELSRDGVKVSIALEE